MDALPPPADAAGLPVDDKLTAFELEFAQQIDAKIEDEKTAAQQLKKTAEEYLDSWYDKRTDRKMEAAASNRKDEQELMGRMAHTAAEAAQENPFKQVYELIGPPDPTGDQSTSRMRSLILNLKIHGGPERDAAHNEDLKEDELVEHEHQVVENFTYVNEEATSGGLPPPAVDAFGGLPAPAAPGSGDFGVLPAPAVPGPADFGGLPAPANDFGGLPAPADPSLADPFGGLPAPADPGSADPFA